MTWRQQMTIKLLLLVARIVTSDSDVRLEIKNIANQIALQSPQD